MKIDKAWMLYLSSIDNISYLYMLLSVYKQLKDTKTKYPIFCGLTKNIDNKTRKILQKIGLNLIDLDTSKFENTNLLKSNDKNHMCIHYKSALSKLAILGSNIEEKFNKIVYIDTDYIIYDNMDELFDKPHMSAIEDEAPAYDKKLSYEEGKSIFCSGLFVWDFEHNKGKGQEIIDKLDNLNPNIAWHDQNILNYYYQNWRLEPSLQLSPMYGLMNATLEEQNYKGKVKARHIVTRIRSGWPDFDSQEAKNFARRTSKLYLKDFFNIINSSINYYNATYNLNLKLLNYEHIFRQSYIPHVVVKESTAFTGLPDEWWKEEF